MEPAERIESRTALRKRQRSRALPRTASMVTVPSAAKQGRQEGAADVPSSTSLPDASVGMGAAGGGAPQRGYSSGSYLAGAQTAAFLMACGLCSRSLGPGRDTYIYRFEIDITDDFFLKKKTFPGFSVEWPSEFPLFSRHDSVADVAFTTYEWLISVGFFYSTSELHLDRISFPSRCGFLTCDSVSCLVDAKLSSCC
jgi:hypothetical protein